MIDRIEQQFGNYHLVKLVGEGGFGKVHLGRHLHSDTEVAIKILDTQLISREQEDFLQEARVIASLDHPSIVRLLDCGIEGDKPFLTMNYAPNGTLRQRHPKGCRVPLQQILTYVKPIASALHYAHERKLIHRDIKPENMLLGNHDEVLLGDFGIALISSSSTSRSTKTAAGTVSYMAPEQILGKPGIASDQYALGIVIYEWLCGTLPFHGSFAEVGQQHLYAPPPSFEEQGVEIAPSVEAVVRKALAKKPEERFADVQEFAMALEESFLRPETVITSAPVLPRTESDMFIFAQDANRWQEEPVAVRKTPEPLGSPAPASSLTANLPTGRSGTRRNLIVVLSLLLLASFVTSAVLYTSLLTVRSPAPSPIRISTRAQPTLGSTAPPASTSVPTTAPTVAPTDIPTLAPTSVPTAAPTVAPTDIPTVAPTSVPTTAPTVAPTDIPTLAPTIAPTVASTDIPTSATVPPGPTSPPTPGHGLTVGPVGFGLSGCPTDANGNWQCRVLLTSDPDNQNTIAWYATINGGVGVTLSQQNYQTGAILNQDSGQLTPGEPVWIIITVPQSNCPGIGSGSISFTGPANVTTTTWNC